MPWEPQGASALCIYENAERRGERTSQERLLAAASDNQRPPKGGLAKRSEEAMPSIVEECLVSGIEAVRAYVRKLDANAIRLDEEDRKTAYVAGALFAAISFLAAIFPC